MTRLRTEWISHITEGMREYNEYLKRNSGIDLSELVMLTADINAEKLHEAAMTERVAVVPVTQGQGIIATFSESIASIIESMGFEAYVTENTDIDGIYEGMENGTDIFFFADDERYLAVNMGAGVYGENDRCTALGYIRVLENMMKQNGRDIRKEKILVIGYGRVGKQAVPILEKEKIDFDIFDKDFDKLAHMDYYKLSSLEEIRNYRYILDLTNEGGWLTSGYLDDEVIYASPGIPCSLDEKAINRLMGRAVYDDLEIGTAVMLSQVICR